MLVYVAHCYSADKRNIKRARKITHDLAVADRANTYVCPLLCFSYLRYNEIGYDEEIGMCTDLLGECAKMIVASEISRGVQLEIDFCNEWDIPIEFYKPKVETIWQRIYHKLFPI